MNLSKREYIALELLKEIVKVNIDDAVNTAYLLADEFIGKSSDSHTIEKHNIFKSHVEELQMSVRTTNCLLASGIRSVGELVSYRDMELLQVKNLGKKSREEIVLVLSSLGLRLDMKEPDIILFSEL